MCKMAANPDRLDLIMAAGIYKDMLQMVEQENKWRKVIMQSVSVGKSGHGRNLT